MAADNKKWLSQLQEKVRALRELREVAEDRVVEVEECKKEAEEKRALLEETAQGLRNRIQLIQKETESTLSAITKSEQKLADLHSKSTGDNDTIKVLEESDMGRDENLHKLESIYNDVKKEEEEKTREVEDCMRKYDVAKAELDKTLAKIDHCEKSIAEKDNELMSCESLRQQLEDADSKRYENCELLEAKIQFLETEIEAQAARGDEAERMVNKRQREVEEVNSEAAQYRYKMSAILDDFDNLQKCVDDI